MAYLLLFFTAFLAATLLPAQSEALLAALVLADCSLVWLLFAASAGNVLGSTVNWWLGRGIARFSDRRWFPVGPAAMARAQRWYTRYGKWSLLLSWVPVIGDPITLVAGVMREPLRVFLLLVTVAKVGRYVLVATLALRYA